MSETFSIPTETIKLASEGLIYPESNPLSKGSVEMRYMTAKHEDILANQNYIQKGIVLDKLIQALVVTPINYEDLIIGDINTLLIAARVLGYGKDYEFKFNGKQETVDLSLLENKPLNKALFVQGKNEFSFQLPKSGTNITFKILTKGDEIKIQQELEGLKRINPNSSVEISTRWKYMITSVEENRETKLIREFVDDGFIAQDANALREYIKSISPDVDLTFFPEGTNTPTPIPIGLSFFWVNL